MKVVQYKSGNPPSIAHHLYASLYFFICILKRIFKMDGPMSISAMEAILLAVQQSLKAVPRNDYERQNCYNDNMGRLALVRERLSSFTGNKVASLLKRAGDLERDCNVARFQVAPSENGNAFALDFEEEGGDDEVDILQAHSALAEELRRAKLSQRSKGRGKERKENRRKGNNVDAATTVTSALPSQSEKFDKIPVEKVQDPRPLHIVRRYDGCPSDDIPTEAVSEGVCSLVEGTPMAAIEFHRTVEIEGQLCHCRVVLFRCVLLALAFGQPTDTERADISPRLLTSASDASLNEDYDEEEVADGDDLTALSKQLVAEYDEAQLEQEELERASTFPKECPPLLRERIRHLTALSWVVLLCHGGYFAGGVFVNGTCVVHKSFQRYVVRKKQGGKQSTAAKEGGSYGSIGSQIRAAQEVKWKADVRDILIRWRRHIDAANIILYAAPGPQNRSVLTDFSLLPAATSTMVANHNSPISVNDSRVHKVPLTSHRPNFEEVQRIYSTVSTCSIEYVLNE